MDTIYSANNFARNAAPPTPQIVLPSLITHDRAVLWSELPSAGIHAIQAKLHYFGLLDPIFGGSLATPFRPVAASDGLAGKETRAALREFCRLIGQEQTYLDGTVSRLQLVWLEYLQPSGAFSPSFVTLPDDSRQTRIAKAVLRYMRRCGHYIAYSPNARNIVYVEGMNSDGTLNNDAIDQWNDRRMVIGFEKGQPVMLVNDQATTEPGKYYTQNPGQMGQVGVARIAFGQYKAWQMGRHNGWQPALVQNGLLRIYRDVNKDGRRSYMGRPDPIQIGTNAGINQHSTTPNSIPLLVNRYSAGCLVGRRYRWHLSFLNTIAKDYRYVNNPGYKFISAVLAGDDLLKFEKI